MVDAALLRARIELTGAQQAAAEARGFGVSLDNVGRQAGTAGERVRDAQGRFVAAGKGAEEAGKAAQGAGRGFTSLRQGIDQLSPVALGATGAVVGVGLAAKGAMDASIQWESALAGIAKTLDTTGLSAAEAEQAVADIGAEIRAMALDIPITAVELAGVAEAAGQLGIAREDVVSFAETMAKLGVTTDLTAEQSAVAIARISNITQLATEDVDNFGAALVDLGNNSAATESEILNMATRIAAAGNMAGLTEGEILGLSAALTSVGINAEAGGTAISQVMAEITKSVETADDRLELFAEVAGMTASQFAAAWRNEPAMAIAAFVEGLAAIESGGGSSILVLQELELAGIRQTQALRSAAGAGDLMRDSMERGNRAMEEGNALNEEAAQRFETTASQIQLAKNEMRDVAITVGDDLAPAFVFLMEVAADTTVFIADTVGALGDLISEANKLIDTTEEGRTHNEAWGAAFRVLSGGSKDLSADLGLLWEDFREGGTVMDDAQQEAEEMGNVFSRLGQLVKDTWAEIDELATEQAIFEELAAGVPEFTIQLDALRSAGQHAAQQLRADWEQQFAAMGEAVALVPESAAGFIDDLVEQFRGGQASIEQVWSIIGQMPEEELIPALRDVRAEWLNTVAEMGDPTEVRTATQNLAAMDQILSELGISLGETAAGIANFGEVQNLFQQNINNAAAGVSEWQGHLSGAEKALGFLQEKIDAGIPLTAEQQQQYDDLTWATERYAGGVEDEAEALIDAEVAKANFVKIQDELNQALADGKIDQDEYNKAIATAAAELDPATAASMGLLDAQQKLAEGLDGTIAKLVDLLVELGILDETEAEAIVGADTTEAEANVDRMEGRLQTYEGSTYTANLDLSTINAINAYNGFLSYLANNPATIDLYVNQPNAIGFTQNAVGTGPGGGISQSTLSWVGEEGPELAWLPRGTHILPNDESMKFAEILGALGVLQSIPGFADGTGTTSVGMGQRGGSGAVDAGGFTDLGTAIAEAIALGVKLGLIESGTPTGAEYAQAIIDGATEQIDTDGDKVLDAWVVANERIPELAANMGRDTVMGLLQEYTDLQGELQLAILSGEDTGEIQAQLDAIFALFAAWSGNTVENVEAVWDAITDEQKAAAAQAMWEDVLGSIQTPSSPVSIDIDDIISGDAIEDVRAAFFELFNLQQMYEDAGMPEQAAEIGKQMQALGLQEELIESLAGTDTAQKLAEELRLEELAAELDERMDAVLGDNPLGIADNIQSEIDDLQAKIDLGPAMGATAEQIAAWQDELAGLTGEQTQFWDDMQAAFDAGALDYATALEAGLIDISADMVDELAAIFEDAPDLALDMVDDLLDAVERGALPFEDAMALLADVPKKDLVPALEGLEETLTADLAQALLSFGPDSPEVQAILASLGLIDQALDDVAGSADDATTTLDNLPGSKNYEAPGDQTPGAEPGTSNAGTAGLTALGSPGMSFHEMVAGTRYTMPGTTDWDAWQAAGAVISIDADGLTYPQAGYELWKSGQNVYVNPFANGGIVTSPTLALIGEAGTEGVFPLDRAGEFGFGGEISDESARKIARALADELRRAPVEPHFHVDSYEVMTHSMKHLSNWTPAGARSAP